jgi:hypothetical protein
VGLQREAPLGAAPPLRHSHAEVAGGCRSRGLALSAAIAVVEAFFGLSLLLGARRFSRARSFSGNRASLLQYTGIGSILSALFFGLVLPLHSAVGTDNATFQPDMEHSIGGSS